MRKVFILRFISLLVVLTGTVRSLATPVPIEPTEFSGKVQHLAYNSEGKMTGVVLEDRTYVKFHSEAIENSVAGPNGLKVGSEIQGSGQLTLSSPNKVYERVELHHGAQKIFDDNILQAGTPKPGPSGRFKWMKATSKLIAVSTRLNGQIDQLLLSDGTTVALSKEAVIDPHHLHAGDTIAVTGVGTSFEAGKYIQAMTLTDSNHSSLLGTWKTADKWTLKEGSIKQPIINIQGDVEGLLLNDKTVLFFAAVPFAAGAALVSGTQIRVAGPASRNQIHVDTIYLVESDMVLDAAEAKPKHQSHGDRAKGEGGKGKGKDGEKEERANIKSPMDLNAKEDGSEHAYGIPALARMEDTSRIEMILREPRGEIHTLLLRDGTTVSIPPQLREKVPASLKAGDPVKIFGLGGTSALGASMEALGINRVSGSVGITD